MAEKVYLRKRDNRVSLEDDQEQLPEEYSEFMLIREMGWDYYTFLEQPDWFIDMCIAFINAEIMARRDRKNG